MFPTRSLTPRQAAENALAAGFKNSKEMKRSYTEEHAGEYRRCEKEVRGTD